MIVLYVAGVLFAFGMVIFFHEFGHFIVAKKTGVKVEQFSFGFGKEIFGFQIGETRYTVNWVPLGGYIRMAGEFPEEYKGPVLEGKGETEKDNVDHSRDFMAKPWYHRILIAFAGPFMNYVLAVVIFFGMLLIWGQQIQINKTEVGEVIPGLPAEKAGMRVGDTILEVEGIKVDNFMALAMKIHGRADQKTEIVVDRAGRTMTFNIVPRLDEKMNVGLIGIRQAKPVTTRKKVGVFSAAKKAVWQCWNISAFTLAYLGDKIIKRQAPDVAGPIGITQVIVKAVQAGWEDFMYLIAMISVAIGLFNLFPIPLLDGGHVVYYLVEGIRGKPLSQAIMGRANMVGMALLLSLLVFATINDIQRFKKNPEKPTTTQE